MTKSAAKIRILHLIYDDPANPWVGGGGAIRTWTINGLLAKDAEITVLCGMFPGAKREETVKAVRIIRVGSGKSYFISRLTFVSGVRRLVKSLPHDLLVEEFSGNSPTFAACLTKKPSVAVLQNYLGTSILKKRPVIGLVPWLYEKIGIRCFTAFVPVSETIMRRFLPRIGREKFRSVPQGLGPEFFKKRRTAEKYMLFVGRLDFYQKGIDVLLKALAMNKDLGVKLLMVGGGDAARLGKMIGRCGLEGLVEHRPRVEHDRLPAVYADSYFLCLPSRYEGWPLVCLESYALGKPVLGTDIAGLKDVLVHGRTGLKTNPDDAAAWAKAMRELLTDSALRKRLGQGAKKISTGFAWPLLAARQLAFYREVAGREKK